MVKAEKDLCCLKLIGGHLALNFANSIWRRTSDTPCEILSSYGLLVEWSRQAGALTEERAKQLQEEGTLRTAEAQIVLERARALREAIHEVFAAISVGSAPDPRAMATLNCDLSTAVCRRRIEGIPPDFTWAWNRSPGELDQMLWPIVHSAADLLTSDDLRWIRICAADDCDRLFLDTSKNRRRRWCSMEWCGNRAKARRAGSQASEKTEHRKETE